MLSLVLPLAALQAVPAVAASVPGDPLPADWRAIPDDEVMVMTLAGNRRVVIRLAARYAPEHVANLRRMAAARYWDGTTVYRVQDNWVTQWGGQPGDAPDDPGNKPLPAGVAPRPAAEYEVASGIAIATPLGADAYAPRTGITDDGWAVAASAPASGARETGAAAPAWLAHCYGTVGVARDAAPDTGSGSELFMAIGGSARRLDRNYTIVGRVIDGAGYLSGLPRSDAVMGMYADTAQRVPIVAVRLAGELPASERPHYQYRAAGNARYAAAITARRHPKGMVSSGGLDVCDAPLPTRRAP